MGRTGTARSGGGTLRAGGRGGRGGRRGAGVDTQADEAPTQQGVQAFLAAHARQGVKQMRRVPSEPRAACGPTRTCRCARCPCRCPQTTRTRPAAPTGRPPRATASSLLGAHAHEWSNAGQNLLLGSLSQRFLAIGASTQGRSAALAIAAQAPRPAPEGRPRPTFRPPLQAHALQALLRRRLFPQLPRPLLRRRHRPPGRSRLPQAVQVCCCRGVGLGAVLILAAGRAGEAGGKCEQTASQAQQFDSCHTLRTAKPAPAAPSHMLCTAKAAPKAPSLGSLALQRCRGCHPGAVAVPACMTTSVAAEAWGRAHLAACLQRSRARPNRPAASASFSAAR